VPAGKVFQMAEEAGAIPYDIPGAELCHDGEFCSFDAFLSVGATDSTLNNTASAGCNLFVYATHLLDDPRPEPFLPYFGRGCGTDAPA
jgi:hypothetical protein